MYETTYLFENSNVGTGGEGRGGFEGEILVERHLGDSGLSCNLFSFF